MKPEMLETLLLDRALGELTPEVAALLDAYLAQNPAAAPRAAEIADTLQLARGTFTSARETPRPLDLERLQRERQVVRSRAWRAQVLRLVACLVVGVAAGWTLRPARPPAAVVTVTPITVIHPARHAEPATQFWSLARFAPETKSKPTEKKL